MTPALMTLTAWVAFGGSHILLGSSRLRGWLKGRIGTNGFMVTYSSVAALTLSWLIVVVAVYGDQGRAGPF